MNLIGKFWKTPTDPYPVRARALVCEDCPDQSDFLAGLLRLQNVIVTQAGNIAGTLEILKDPAQQFELAFVDLDLGGTSSGVEVVRRIKNARRMTMVVIVSGNPNLILSALSYGYVSILSKPYSVGAIADVLRLHRLPHAD